jgi:sRNA-binding carbon storage regulator CsrA
VNKSLLYPEKRTNPSSLIIILKLRFWIVKGDQVKIGISAPKSIPVYRKEVYLADSGSE